MRQQPLAGIRVLDLSRILAAPWASQMLGDFGAEVIKVERPGKGDDSRNFGPPFVRDTEGNEDHSLSPMYISANRNKRSITVDLSRPEGQELIRKLAAQSDILLENYKVGDLKRYGLDYESLRKINPRLIYCSVTGFGQTGPYRLRPGYDGIFQAMGGLMSTTGIADDQPGGGPMKVGVSIGDVITGLYAYAAISTALYHRDQVSNEGQHLDIALLDSVIAATSHHAAVYLGTGKLPQRLGTTGGGGVPAQLFRCADGDLMVVVGNDDQFRRLCEVLRRPDLAADERFIKNSGRALHRTTLMPILEELFLQRSVDEVYQALDAAAVPAGPVNTFDRVFDDPQVKSRGNMVEVPHPVSGTLKIGTNPVHFSETPITRYTAPPTLGQHTDEVLRDVLGLGEEDIRGLREAKVI